MEKQFKPSLEKVMKDLDGFQHEIKMYVYHKLNGRDDEAQSYLDTYNEEQTQMKEELTVSLTEKSAEEIQYNNQSIKMLEFEEEFNNIEI